MAFPEQLNIDLFKKTLGPVQKVMKDADLKLSEVDEIVLVGGSTRIPKVRTNMYPLGTSQAFAVVAQNAVLYLQFLRSVQNTVLY